MTPEFYKGLMHFGAGVLAGTMGFYQGLRLTEEKEARTHLWVNLGVYALATGFEAVQTYRHWSKT